MMKLNNSRVGEICKLSELSIGNVAKVKKINSTNSVIRRRLYDMGITSGVVLEIRKIAPLGDPVGIRIRGYELCLRKFELKNVDVKVIK